MLNKYEVSNISEKLCIANSVFKHFRFYSTNIQSNNNINVLLWCFSFTQYWHWTRNRQSLTNKLLIKVSIFMTGLSNFDGSLLCQRYIVAILFLVAKPQFLISCFLEVCWCHCVGHGWPGVWCVSGNYPNAVTKARKCISWKASSQSSLIWWSCRFSPSSSESLSSSLCPPSLNMEVAASLKVRLKKHSILGWLAVECWLTVE